MGLLPLETWSPLGLEHLGQGGSVPPESPLIPELSPGEGGGSRSSSSAGGGGGMAPLAAPPACCDPGPSPLSALELCL